VVLPATVPVEFDVIVVPPVCAPPVRQPPVPPELLPLEEPELLVAPELLDALELLAPELLAPELLAAPELPVPPELAVAPELAVEPDDAAPLELAVEPVPELPPPEPPDVEAPPELEAEPVPSAVDSPGLDEHAASTTTEAVSSQEERALMTVPSFCEDGIGPGPGQKTWAFAARATPLGPLWSESSQTFHQRLTLPARRE
jgi:hypothetical protein